ncbi:cytoplasmic 60S subunit biogenesis factor ZNF622-like [Glandiceps talaboti]
MATPSQYTCISCRVAFASPEIQRSHYKSDWHRYNLKRKVADLPPVTAENFQQKVLAQRAQSEEAEKDTSSQCKICNKHFNTQNAYENHMKSKKHKEIEAKITKKIKDDMEKKIEKGHLENEDSEVAMRNALNLARAGYKAEDKNSAGQSAEPSGGTKKKMKTNEAAKLEDEMDTDSEGSWGEVEGEAIEVTDCLFCSHSSSSIEINVQHMTKEHSFFIPNIEYMVDLEGLMRYLGEKVGEGFMCLWCNEKGRSFYSVPAAQNHMKDKGHCKLLYEGDAIYEYSDFYDFRRSYPDYEQRQAKRAARLAEQGAGSSSSGAVDDGMDVDSDDDNDNDVPDKSVDINEDGELVLPSGARVGHRDLMRYYKQNLPPIRRTAGSDTKNRAILGNVISQYKALGWTGATGEAAERKIKDLRVIQKWKASQEVRLGVKTNKFQPHFRPQVRF